MPSVLIVRDWYLTIYCADPYALASFWAKALGGKMSRDNFPGDPEAGVTGARPTLWFLRVDNPEMVKNHLHLDLQPQDRTRDLEVERLLSLGATLKEDCRRFPRGWVRMCDPEGNEFNVVQSAAERWSQSR